MKRAKAGTYQTYKQSSKRQKSSGTNKKPATRKGYGSVARARGANVTGEMKYFDTENTGQALTAVTTTWPANTMCDPTATINLGVGPVVSPLCLFDPTVGAALNQRIGRKCWVYKIKINGCISVNSQVAQTVADSASKVRIALVMDRQTNAAQMTGAALYNDATTASATIQSFQNPNNFGRFAVLKEKFFVMQNPNIAQNTASTIEQQGLKTSFKFNVNFKTPIVVNFNAANGGTVQDIIDNSFHVVGASDLVPLSPTISYYCRVCYKD